MDNEIQLISDGEGLAVIGEPTAVELFLSSEGLKSKELDLRGFSSALGDAASATQAWADFSANSGRWVKLTKESAQLISKHGLRTSKATGLSTGVLAGPKGQIAGFVQFAQTPAQLANPAILSGLGAMMAQRAMQQKLDEITDYLEEIDAKVDEILRAQKDSVLADMIGVDLVINEAMMIRREVGRVSEVTWSKVQATTLTIARTQAYALRQLDALAEKVEHQANVGDLAESLAEVQNKVHEWLAVLARCFQLQEATGILELDRVVDSSPEELDKHRLGLKAARQQRLEVISRTTHHLLERMDLAAAQGRANSNVLLHPSTSRNVVRATNGVGAAVDTFHDRIGIDSDRAEVGARRWLEAAADVRDKALEAGADGVGAARRAGDEAVDRARLVTGRIASNIAERALRKRDDDPSE
ncbi:hypothetical protein GCM10022286_30750 [Gryllotalpicola daejeonensis]|uniref:Toxic anion resistance protein n=1 Tax=Gryllotalpicola daejeonensis TaxID=993087 RepID=A0ABP7ZNR1_9MICO